MVTTFTTPREAAEAYSRWVRRTGLSDRTMETYSGHTLRFVEWLESKGGEYNAAIGDPYERDYAVRDYRRELLTVQCLAPRTVAQHISALGSFYDWIGLGRAEGVGVDLPDPDRTGIESEADRRAVLRAAQRRGERDYAIIGLMMFAGPRVDEVARLNVDDIAITERTGQLAIRYGKGGKTRTLPLMPPARDAVRPWLRARDGLAREGERALFVNRTGTRLSVRSIQSAHAQVAAAANIPMTPHTLRHTFAHFYLDNGGDVVTLQKLLGHASLESTRVYLNRSASAVADQMNEMTFEL